AGDRGARPREPAAAVAPGPPPDRSGERPRPARAGRRRRSGPRGELMIRARCEVLSSRAAGAYQSVTLVAPEIAERVRPGQFVEVAMPDGRAYFLRRPFFVHQASRRGGWAGTVELIVDRHGPGSSWLAETHAHEFVDLIGPCGNGFGIPRPTNC